MLPNPLPEGRSKSALAIPENLWEICRMARWVSRIMPWVGMGLILAYWYSIHPPGYSKGYTGDMCVDVLRQHMADSLLRFGGPRFTSDQLMFPFGASAPFMSWAVERDWLGAYFWMWNREFPFQWVYFGVSLLVTYSGVGLILRRMEFSRIDAWLFATAVVLFHVPRHFKIWHHYEHLQQHWFYWSLFLDLWIWHLFWRRKRWSRILELWRGVCLVGMFSTAGYFWGPLIMEWALTRCCMLWVWRSRRRKGVRTEAEGGFLKAIPPLALGTALVWISFRWYLPLAAEVKRVGAIGQGLGWFVRPEAILRPLWLDSFLSFTPWPLTPLDSTETVAAVGWFYWVPFVVSLWILRKKNGGPGLQLVLPFLLFLISGLLYMIGGHPHYFPRLVVAVVPFMNFFRVGVRWGLFLPQILGAIIILAWPDLAAWWRKNRSRKLSLMTAGFMALSAVEFGFLFYPVNTMPPISSGLTSMLGKIREFPGEAVLDLPFCVAGGNGTCTAEQCPNYPDSITGECFRQWHDKKVYGLYQARMSDDHCKIYRRPPYQSWFESWKQQRCFTDSEWSEFCHYLSDHQEISAVLVYPDIWTGAGSAECRAKFEEHLGKPKDEQVFASHATRGGVEAPKSRVVLYPAVCR